MEKAALTVDERQRNALYADAEGIIVDDAPWIFLWNGGRRLAFSKTGQPFHFLPCLQRHERQRDHSGFPALTMKSSVDQLAARGFAPPHADNDYATTPGISIVLMLTKGTPVERTIAARLIAHRKNTSDIPGLCDALVKETKLYTKIALCEALASFGESAIPHLLPLLGRIGKKPAYGGRRC